MSYIVSKPDYGVKIVDTDTGQSLDRLRDFFDDLESKLNSHLLGNQVTLPSYLLVDLPPVGNSPGLIFVSDATGGSVPAYSDGVYWRRVTDGVVVS